MDEPQHPTGAGWSVGGRFMEALAERDFEAIASCLDSDICFRALVPPGPFELRGPAEVISRLERWFGGSDRFDLLDASIGAIGDRLYLRWRVRMTAADASHKARVVEQHAFATATDAIHTLDLLCSGFVVEGQADCGGVPKTAAPVPVSA